MKKFYNLLYKIGKSPEVFFAGTVVAIIAEIVMILLFKLGLLK
jgi:hypothetical protein